MIEMDLNHWQIVSSSLGGEREVDEQTFASLSILSERLGRLKGLDDAFKDVGFSPAVRKLKEQRSTVAVG